MPQKASLLGKLKNLIIGGTRSPTEHGVFHKISLIAFFAWVGLGADGLSSSCYGPQEAFLVLNKHMYLGVFVAIATAITVFVISSSYSQIIELFPAGGGGYLVASKLLSPSVGMVAGCALLIDYVLTIAVSVASGADALFSFLPSHMHPYKLAFAGLGVLVLTVMNLRGVRESILPLVPIFLIFVVTHIFAIVYAPFAPAQHAAAAASQGAGAGGEAGLVGSFVRDISSAHGELGLMGMLILILRAYGMGAGTYTGIEAVSNGMPMLREPRVKTARRTMWYMAASLAFTAGGLMIAYILHHTQPTATKTANAVLLDSITAGWGRWGEGLVLVTLISEAAILFVAAQTGFMGGPRILANMAMDRWLPSKFTLLSDRLVTSHGIVLMGLAALVMVLVTRGQIGILVVLYSINVFITFVLSQLGMVRHWWQVRREKAAWKTKLGINGLGLFLTGFILVSMVVIKFHEGGWITLLVTGTLVCIAVLIRRHYRQTLEQLKRLDGLVAVSGMGPSAPPAVMPKPTPGGNTAAILVNGFNGLGLHSLMAVIRMFGKSFDNYVFVQVGVVDAGNFKGAREVSELKEHVESEVNRYVEYMARNGVYAEAHCAIGVELVEEIAKISDQVRQKYPNLVFFGGQLVFAKDSFLNRMLHNYIVFAVQRRLYNEGIPFVVLPVRI